MNTHKTLLALSLWVGALAPFTLSASGVEFPKDASQQSKPATIKVLIEKNQNQVLLEAKGRYEIYNPFNDLLLAQGSSTTRHWISPSENGLVWDELIPGSFQVRLVPKGANSSLLVNGIEYKGCVEVYDVGGKISVVNEVDIERYLKSIMTSQFSSEMDEEVMDAIAITARTNAYYLVSHTPVTFWHVDAKEINYQGYALTLQNLHVDRAINNTRHMVMNYQGSPFPTTWTKDSAGRTADFATVFRKHVKTPEGVETPFAAHEKEKHLWTFSISRQDLAKALGAVKVSEFDLYQDSASHKVYAARLKDGEKTTQIDFVSLQKALSPNKLKSNDFSIESKGDQVLFKGFGEGVGVGLCLFSAAAMADKGEKAPKILEALFPGTKLERVRSLPQP